MLVALCSDKGSPGTTTTALALASARTSGSVLVEADLFGGDLALRLRTRAGTAFPEAPTVLTLSSAARTVQAPDLVERYAHEVNNRVSVVPGPLVAEQAGTLMDFEPLGRALAASSGQVLVDVGRLHAASPMLPVAARADVVLLVARTDTASVIRLRERASRLVPALAASRGAAPRLFPVLVTAARHGVADAADVARILSESPAGPLVVGCGFVAWDQGAVERLEAGEDPTGRLARSPLLRSSRELWHELGSRIEPSRRTAPARVGEKA
ncbi:hypothetical protein [Nocardioides terrisoli]|uniref:hypothetical protein n=1 Tax=Nocardioides terrisoli TaxID=3388267 RepID=UPI00287B9B57|nr:hypothetical protein [Nocardioides marmorisolisilvae]